MSDVKNPIRTSGQARRKRAQATRRRMIEAAYHLFASYGYAVPMDAIAKEAQVAVQTLYFTFHTKAELLREALRYAAGGEHEPAQVPDRPWYSNLKLAPTGRHLIAQLVEHGVDIFSRMAPLAAAVQAAAQLEPEVARWRNVDLAGRRAGMGETMEILAAHDWLRAGMTTARATDILFVLQSPATLDAYMNGCGWTLEGVKAWLYLTLCEQLLSREQLDVTAADDGPTEGRSFAAALATERVR